MERIAYVHTTSRLQRRRPERKALKRVSTADRGTGPSRLKAAPEVRRPTLQRCAFGCACVTVNRPGGAVAATVSGRRATGPSKIVQRKPRSAAPVAQRNLGAKTPTGGYKFGKVEVFERPLVGKDDLLCLVGRVACDRNYQPPRRVAQTEY